MNEVKRPVFIALLALGLALVSPPVTKPASAWPPDDHSSGQPQPSLETFESGATDTPPPELFQGRRALGERFAVNTSSDFKFNDFAKMTGGLISERKTLDLDEIQASPIEVVVQKASQFTPKPGQAMTLVDDTSLEVEGHDVGVNMRWALESGALDAMAGKKATWTTLLAYHDGSKIRVYKGVVTGTIVKPKVSGGTNFDVLFVPDGNGGKTLAESRPPGKNARWLAIKAFLSDAGETHAPITHWEGAWQHGHASISTPTECIGPGLRAIQPR